MVKEKKTGKMFAMKCVKKKQKRDLNLENEITVLRRFDLFYFCFDGLVSVRRAVKSAFFFFFTESSTRTLWGWRSSTRVRPITI